MIEDTLGTEFDPSDIKTQDDFAALLQSLRDNGMKNPISMAKEDWSLGAHQLQYIYETYNGTSDGAAEVINELKDGTLYLPDYTRMNEFLNTFDLLKEYNVAKGDPLGADYDEMAIDLADGKTAFWFNGNWAWPNLEEAGAETTDEYGFLPYFLNNDPDDFVNSKIQASPSKQIMLDDIVATDEQKAAAKEFLNWLVYSEIGQQMVVLDILINAERIADQCSNLGVYTISQFDPSVMNSHHEYIHRLHQGNDPVFNREYQEKHEKYFGMLSAIND